MTHGNVIATTETFAVVVAGAGLDMGVTIFIPVVHIGRPVVIEILARAFNAVMKTLPLNIPKF